MVSLDGKKPASGNGERSYTFTVACTFCMQYTFREDEVQPDEGGGAEDFEPTDETLLSLEQEIKEKLQDIWGGVTDVDASADSESLIAFE